MSQQPTPADPKQEGNSEVYQDGQCASEKAEQVPGGQKK